MYLLTCLFIEIFFRMNTKTVSDYWKKAVSITTGKEKKDRSGGYSLVFAGSVFSLLGCNYLYKYSFI